MRTIGLVGLLTFAVTFPMDVTQRLWIAGGLPLPAATLDALAHSPPPDIWRTAWIVAGALWLVAYLLLVTGRHRASLLLALTGLGFDVAWATAAADDGPSMSLTLWCQVLMSASVIAALTAFHRDAPPVRRRPWLLALAAGGVGSSVLGILILLQPIGVPVVPDWPGLLCIGWIVAALVHRADAWPRRALSVSLALVLLCAPVLLLRIVSLVEYAVIGLPPGAAVTVSLGIVETIVILALAVSLAVQTMRRLPPPPVAAVPPAPTSWRS